MGVGSITVGIAQLTREVRGNKGSMVVRRLLLDLLSLGDARRLGRLGLAVGEGHAVEVTLVGPGQALVLAGSLLASETNAGDARTLGLLGGLGRLGRSIRILGSAGLLDLGLDSLGACQVFDYKLLIGKVVIKCDTGQKADGVFLDSGSKDNAEGIHS